MIESIAKTTVGEHLRQYYTPRGTLRPIRYPEAVERIRALMETGGVPDAEQTPPPPESDLDDSPAGTSIQEIAHEEIAECIHSLFPAHELERLIAAVLTAEGYVALQSHIGPDQGVDVLAGHGSMGFDSPRICVQVKHTTSKVAAPDIQQLCGAITQF